MLRTSGVVEPHDGIRSRVAHASWNVAVASLLEIMKGRLVKLFDLVVFAVVMSPENLLEVGLAGRRAAVVAAVCGVQIRLSRKVCRGSRADTGRTVIEGGVIPTHNETRIITRIKRLEVMDFILRSFWDFFVMAVVMVRLQNGELPFALFCRLT